MNYVYNIIRDGAVVHVCDSADLAISWCEIYENKYPESDFKVLKCSVWTNADFKYLDINKL